MYSKLRSRDTYTAKGLVNPLITAFVIVSYLIANASDLMVQEQDYVYDSLLMLCIGALWIT